MSKQKTAPVLRVGDYVTIPDTTYPSGRIVEARGRLGPGGAQIFRVRIPGKLLLTTVMVMFTIFGIPLLIALPFLLAGFLGL